MDTTVDLCLQESPGKGIGRNESKVAQFLLLRGSKAVWNNFLLMAVLAQKRP